MGKEIEARLRQLEKDVQRVDQVLWATKNEMYDRFAQVRGSVGEPEQPEQPVVVSPTGTRRYQVNQAVQALVRCGEKHGFALHEIASAGFTTADRRQLYQLIGYSVSGFWDVFGGDKPE
jgi:hypothetical protein